MATNKCCIVCPLHMIWKGCSTSFNLFHVLTENVDLPLIFSPWWTTKMASPSDFYSISMIELFLGVDETSDE